MTLPGFLALLATLALRMEAGEAEWLAASLLQASARLRELLTRLPHTSWDSPARPVSRRIIHPCGC